MLIQCLDLIDHVLILAIALVQLLQTPGQVLALHQFMLTLEGRRLVRRVHNARSNLRL